jgi:uncharacterized protein Usg
MQTLTESKLTKKQTKKMVKTYKEDGNNYKITVELRYDDECGNNHNTFAITADIRENNQEYMGGCCHDEIAKHFPELQKYIKWHGVTSEGPLHYISNTLYYAGDKDCWGLRQGEFNSFTYDVMANGKELFRSRIFYRFRNWLHRGEAKAEAEAFMENIKPELNPHIVQVGYGEPSKGQIPNLGSARSSAVWPDATLEQLQSKEALEARLPALMDEFRQAMEELGFTY